MLDNWGCWHLALPSRLLQSDLVVAQFLGTAHIQAYIQVWETIQAHIQVWEHRWAHIQAHTFGSTYKLRYKCSYVSTFTPGLYHLLIHQPACATLKRQLLSPAWPSFILGHADCVQCTPGVPKAAAGEVYCRVQWPGKMSYLLTLDS